MCGLSIPLACHVRGEQLILGAKLILTDTAILNDEGADSFRFPHRQPQTDLRAIVVQIHV